jgi:polyisoprenoid-binding protein YceI
MNRKILIPIAIVVVLGGGALVATTAGLFSDDPEEVSLDNATSAPQRDGDIEFEGTWSVSDGSIAGYRITEQLAGIGANTAVGRTDDVEGSMTIAGDEITDVGIEVDLTSLESDRQMRDNALRGRGLETDRFPTARFELAEPIEIAEEPAEGEEISVQATGDFTLHGVTKRVTIPIDAKWSGNSVTVVSSFGVDLDDYDIERPTTARVVSIADKGTVELQLAFARS